MKGLRYASPIAIVARTLPDFPGGINTFRTHLALELKRHRRVTKKSLAIDAQI